MEYDEILTQLAGRAGSLEGTLDAFFGFLNRRTDLYMTFNKDQKDARMGFPVGVAEEMVLQSMRKYPFKPITQSNDNSNINTKNNENQVEQVRSKINKLDLTPKKISSDTTHSKKSASPSSTNKNSSNDTVFKLKYNEDGKQIPIGNGGITEKYYWTQSLKDLTLYVKVPQGTRGKQITCDIKTNHFKLKLLDEILLNGKFERDVIIDDSFWTLNLDDKDPIIVINLEKRNETWWKSILEGEPEIDTTKVDSTKKISEYDETTQGAIRKIMYDQAQKRKGLLTSDEQRNADILEKAKFAPGSPFLDDNFEE